jgi:hypothetical protein
MNVFSVQIGSLFYLLLLGAITLHVCLSHGRQWTTFVLSGVVGVSALAQYAERDEWNMSVWIPIAFAGFWFAAGALKSVFGPEKNDAAAAQQEERA